MFMLMVIVLSILSIMTSSLCPRKLSSNMYKLNIG